MNKIEEILKKISSVSCDVLFAKNESERYKTLTTEYPENKVFLQVASIYDASFDILKRELYALSVELNSETKNL